MELELAVAIGAVLCAGLGVWSELRQRRQEEAKKKARDEQRALEHAAAEEETRRWFEKHEANARALVGFGPTGKIELREDVEKVALLWQGVDTPPQIGDRPCARLVPTLEEEDRPMNKLWIHRLPLKTVHVLPAISPHPSVLSCLVNFAPLKTKEHVLFLNTQGELERIGLKSRCNIGWCHSHKYCYD